MAELDGEAVGFRRRHQLAFGAVKQGEAELLLELLQESAHRRLRDTETTRRGADRARLHDRVEGLHHTRRRGPPALSTDLRFDAIPHNARSEEHTSELQLLMRISYAGFCLQK